MAQVIEILAQERHSINRRLFTTFFALLALGIQSQGCSSSDNDASQTYTYDELRTVLASSYCGALRDCCTAANTAYSETCIHQVIPQWFLPEIQAQRFTATILYRREAADRCAAAIHRRMAQCAGEASSAEAFISDVVALNGACADVVDGTARPGEECERDYSHYPATVTTCAHAGPNTRGACGWLHRDPNDPSQNRSVGKCYQLTISKLGEPCDPQGTPLVEGKYEGYRRCDGLVQYCELPNGAATSGICKPLKAAGESCRPWSDQNTQSECNLGGCDRETNTCKPFAREGERCGEDLSICADGLECRGPDGCDVFGSPGCPAGQGTCAKPKRPMFSVAAAACQSGPQPN